MATTTKASKTGYGKERILDLGAGTDPDETFRNDYRVLWKEPGFHIVGPCPSCGHETSAVCAIAYLPSEAERPRSERATRLRALLPTRVVAAQGSRTYVTALRCACIENHALPDKQQASPKAEPGAGPRNDHGVNSGDANVDGDKAATTFADAFGCGAEWLLRVTLEPIEPPPPTHSDQPRDKVRLSIVPFDEAVRSWPAAEAAFSEAVDAPSQAETSAKGWGTALTAMLTLLGVGGLLTGRTTVQALPSLWRWVFAAAAAVALCADAFMLYQSNFASFGSPRIERNLVASRPQHSDLDQLMEARTSSSRLQMAVRATAGAAAAAVVAVGVLLLVPSARSPASSKLSLTVNGSTTKTPCGVLVYPTSGGAATAVRFTPNVSRAKAEQIPLREITEIDAC
jgi:hypothetical protein